MTVLLNSPSPIPSSFYRWRSTTHIDVSENVSWKLVGKQTKGTSARNFGEISVTFVCVLFLGGDERTVRAGNLITPVDFWSWDFCWFSEPQKMGTAMVGTKKKRRHTHTQDGPKNDLYTPFKTNMVHLKMTCLKGKFLWTKPPLLVSMLVFWGSSCKWSELYKNKI